MCNNGNDFVGELPDSVIDKWYTIGESFWLRRTTDRNYLCVQIFPLMEHSFLCYLHALDIYPIAFTQDTEKAREMFAAPTVEEKNEWLHKMGIEV